MKDLVEYIAKQIVTNPEAVVVDEQIGEDGSVFLTLTVDPVDMGLVIGKGGQTIKSIRKLLIVRAMGENKRVNLQLFEPEGSRPVKAEESAEIPSPLAGEGQGEGGNSPEETVTEEATPEADSETEQPDSEQVGMTEEETPEEEPKEA